MSRFFVRYRWQPYHRNGCAAQKRSTLESQLGVLQCHFTWGLELSRSKLFRLRDKLKDIGTEEGTVWLGQTYNLRGFIQWKLDSAEDALTLFSKAADALRQARAADEGPWLLVNYSNLAWLHHQQGEEAKSQDYLAKVDALMEEYPSLSQDELHPEIYAEKGWTLMKFGADQKLLAEECFHRATRRQPDMVEWNTSYVLLLLKASKSKYSGVEDDLMEKLRVASQQDPDNLYLAVQYLDQRAKKGQKVEDEAEELAEKVLENPVSSYSGLKGLLWCYINYISVDDAINLAEEALRDYRHVDYVKSCVALCYKWVVTSKGIYPKQSTIDRAVSLHQEVIALYPHSSLVKKLDLANIHAKSDQGLARAEQMYQELLQRTNLEPEDKQMIYFRYANHLKLNPRDHKISTEYYMKTVEIPCQSFFRERSLDTLEKIRDRRFKLYLEIHQFLENLQSLN